MSDHGAPGWVAEMWRTVRYALGSNGRAARLCVIIAVAAVAYWLTHI
jgi:hypothetical protein